MAAGSKRGALSAQPDDTVVWDAWMRKYEVKIAAFEARRDQVFTDWQSLPAIEAEAGKVFAPNQDIVLHTLAVLRWHGAAALPMLDAVLAPLTSARFKLVVELRLRLLRAVHSAAAVDGLLASLAHLLARDAVYDHARRWPLFVLQRLLDLKPNRNQPAAELVQRLLHDQPQWLQPLQDACDDTQRQTLARLQQQDASIVDAGPDELPAILRQPPWRHRAEQPAVAELDLTPLQEPARFHWARSPHEYTPRNEQQLTHWNHGLLVDAGFDAVRELAPAESATWDLPRKALWMLGLDPEKIERAVQEQQVETAWFLPRPHERLPPDRTGSYDMLRHSTLSGSHYFVWHLPPVLAASVLERIPLPHLGNLYDAWSWAYNHDVGHLLRWLEHRALPGLGRLVERVSKHTIVLLQCVEWEGLALDLARAYARNRWVRKEVWRWLTDFADTAARGLIPVALGPACDDRDVAQQALRALVAAGSGAAVDRAAHAYGEAAVQALQAMLAIAPEAVLPQTLPALPKKLFLPALPRLSLQTSDRAIPLAAVPDVLMCLALSSADAAYAGLAQIQSAVTAQSLARFGRELFAWWLENDAPGKERWMFATQGHVGDDETARVLAGAARQWRAALNRVRAYDAAELLGQIGTDVALMHLHGLGELKRYGDLAERAQRMIKEIADARGLDVDQLADRSVPDLGLDADGRLEIDFGTRRFSVHFDEALSPFVRDAGGQRIKDLPKPNSRDDAAMAAAATQQYKDLKKQVRSVGTLQLRRLETAMCRGRRWSADEFTTLFVSHPLLRHLVRRLVWGVYDDADRLLDALRVAEDGSYADRHDRAVGIGADARIGIVHPLALSAELLQDFTRGFVDYEIVQPFEQLQRETHRLDAATLAGADLPQWRGRHVTVASLLGLEQRGWNRAVGDGGIIDSLAKPIDADLSIAVSFSGDPWFVGAPADGSLVQEITHVGLHRRQYADGKEATTFAQLREIDASELLRDLHRMAWFVP